MEVTFAKEYSAILKDLLHYLGLNPNGAVEGSTIIWVKEVASQIEIYL